MMGTNLTVKHLSMSQVSGSPPLRHLQEFRLASVEGYQPGQQLQVEELFKAGDLVDVVGTSIGKGFAGKGILIRRLALHRERDI